MPQLLIDHLPTRYEGEGDKIHTYRHWLIFEDGRIFFQDETLRMEYGELVSSRVEWVQLPTPPTVARVVGIIDHGGLPLAILDNGKSYLWDRSGEVQRWVETFSPVPETAAYAEWNR